VKNLKISHKIFLLSGSMLVVFALVIGWMYTSARHNVIEGRRVEIRHLVESAWGILDHYAQQASQGLLSEEEAQQRAKDAVKALRFGDNNYFWINDMQPRMIMHPLKDDLIGQDLTREKDPNGKAMFVEMTNLCRKNGEGFVEYVFQKPGVKNPVDKISYVKKLPQWNWVIGAGLYLDDIQKTLNQMLFTTLIVLLTLMFGALAVTLLVTRQICRPLAQTVEAMEKLGNGNFDISLDLQRGDEIGQIAEAFNKTIISLRDIFVGVRSMGVRIASNAVRMTKQVELSANHAHEQSEITNDIFASSKEATSAHAEISNNTQHICASTSNNLDKAKSSFKELMEVNGHMTCMSDRIDSYTRTINQMDSESQEIKKIVTLIKSIATQTSLLSLNAAIEAARAGQAGKGFAIVADEVKKLAEEVNTASENIAGKINVMLGHIETSIGESKEVAQYAKVTKAAVAKSCGNFKGMIGEFEKNDDQLQSITASVEELSAANDEIHGKVTTINDVSQEVAQLMEESRHLSEDLYEITERLLESNSQFKTGKGYGEAVVAKTMDLRRDIRLVLEDMNKRGVNVFDQNYQAIPGTSPQKYKTGYDDAFADQIQKQLDVLLRDTKGCSFVLCVDTNGYAPTHNGIYAQPLTGDYQTDLAHSRDKRLFDDKIGLKSARNTKPVLLHSYLRDTGEVLAEFSLPIKVAGKHWGAVRIGLDPEVIID
jgi:methyl-accepting chemotaxis protein